MDNLLFSVVIPTYNRCERLVRAVQSVLQQSYQQFEIIIVDDGGNDNSQAAISEFNDPRINYFWKENEERSIARNFGIDKCKGEYICFLDSDDIWFHNHLDTAFHSIKKDYPPVFHSSYQYTFEDSGAEKPIIVQEVTLEKLLYDNYLTFNAGCIRRDIFKVYRFINSRDAVISEDYYLWLRIAAHYNFICSPIITTAAIEHEQRSLNNIDPGKVARSFNLIIKELDTDPIITSSKYSYLYHRYKASRYLLLALFYSLDNNRPKALLYLKMVVGLHPKFLFSRRFGAVLKKLLVSSFK